MYFSLYFFILQIWGKPHIDSAERRVTAIKRHAQQLSNTAKDFHMKPTAPILFHTYNSLQSDMKKLENEMNLITNSKFE